MTIGIIEVWGSRAASLVGPKVTLDRLRFGPSTSTVRPDRKASVLRATAADFDPYRLLAPDTCPNPVSSGAPARRRDRRPGPSLDAWGPAAGLASLDVGPDRMPITLPRGDALDGGIWRLDFVSIGLPTDRSTGPLLRESAAVGLVGRIVPVPADRRPARRGPGSSVPPLLWTAIQPSQILA